MRMFSISGEGEGAVLVRNIFSISEEVQYYQGSAVLLHLHIENKIRGIFWVPSV